MKYGLLTGFFGYLNDGGWRLSIVDTDTKKVEIRKVMLREISGKGINFTNCTLNANGTGLFNGKSFTKYFDLAKMASETNNMWYMVLKISDAAGNTQGYGILKDGSNYIQISLADAIKNAASCANAFVRDGVLVSKTGETDNQVGINNGQPKAPQAQPVAPIQQTAKPVINIPAQPMAPATPVVNKPVATPIVPTGIAGTVAPAESADMKRMKELVAKLNEARRVYEQGEDEIMTNFEYDQLYDELVALEVKLNTVLPNSPTQEVGYEVVSNLEKRPHETPMLSLGKTKEVADLKAFLGGREGNISWKLDGLTVVATFNGGQLAEAVTRGNGYIGELVTNNAKTFVNMPKRISRVDKIVLRGEAIISYADFDKINNSLAAGVEKYKNPRNLCSGSVRQLDSAITAQRNVRFVVFEWVNAPETMTKTDQLTFVKNLGFEVVQNFKVRSEDLDSVVNSFNGAIANNPYPSDGLVLTYDDVAYGKSLGVTAKTPKHSIAFKWKDELAETELISIDWTVGRSGVITPTAVFKPVELEGTTVTRASMHNISVMTDLLGEHPYVGQKIWVFKANMIIPQIARADKTIPAGAVIPTTQPVQSATQKSNAQIISMLVASLTGHVDAYTSQYYPNDKLNKELSGRRVDKQAMLGFLESIDDADTDFEEFKLAKQRITLDSFDNYGGFHDFVDADRDEEIGALLWTGKLTTGEYVLALFVVDDMESFCKAAIYMDKDAEKCADRLTNKLDEFFKELSNIKQSKNTKTPSIKDAVLVLTDDPRVTRMGSLDQWTVQFEGDELVFHSYEKAVEFADKHGL